MVSIPPYRLGLLLLFPTDKPDQAQLESQSHRTDQVYSYYHNGKPLVGMAIGVSQSHHTD